MTGGGDGSDSPSLSKMDSGDAFVQLRARLEGDKADGLKSYLSSPGGAANLYGYGGASAAASPRQVPGGPRLDDPRPHGSLLATPASRHTGGRLTHRPSPSILGAYESRLEREAGYRPDRGGSALAGAPLAGGTASLGARFTPRAASAAGRAAGIASPPYKPSLLDQFRNGAAGTAGAASLLSRPAPPTAKAASLQEQLQQLQIDCARTAAMNSAVVAASSAATARAAAAASPLLARHYAAAQQPTAALQEQRQQQDFRIPAAFPAGGAAQGFAVSSAAASAGAVATAASDDEGPVSVSLRLTPMFEAIPVGSPIRQPQQQSGAASMPPEQQGPQLGGRQAAAAAVGAWRPMPEGPSVALMESRVNELQAQASRPLLLLGVHMQREVQFSPCPFHPLYVPAAAAGAHEGAGRGCRQRRPAAAAGGAASAGAAAGRGGQRC